jgi:hypothetical protein
MAENDPRFITAAEAQSRFGGGGVPDGVKLYDSGHHLSLDADARTIVSHSNTVIAYWGLDTLGDGTGSKGPAYTYLLTPTDPAHNIGRISIDLQNGYIYDSDGTTILFEWSAGAINIHAATGLFVDKIQDWNGNELANLDLINRKAVASDGTTANINWNNPAGAVVVFPSADPHVAGAAYWVGGVLTKSAG